MRTRTPFALTLALALVACSGDDAASATDATTTTASTATTAGTDASESDSDTAAVDPACGSGLVVKGEGEDKMAKWGAPCTKDEECVALIGEGALCYAAIVDVYKAPGGYCSKPCELMDADPLYVLDHPDCGPGITCLGVNGIFTACLPECTSDAQCQRDGYSCHLLPQIGMENDPTFCLMMDSCLVNPP